MEWYWWVFIAFGIGIGAFLILCLCYVLFLFINSLFVDTKKEYDTNSRYYRALLNGATAILVAGGRIHITVEGREHVPQGRFLVVCNHRSNYDPILTWYILKKHDIAFVSKKENFSIPVFGRFIRKCCFMEIDRKNPRNAMKTIIKAAALIQKDEVSIGIYPEGTRSSNCKLLPFHNGVFKIAQKAKVPILVTTVEGTEKIRKNIPWKKTDVIMHFVGTLSPEEIADVSTKEIGETVENMMRKYVS